jgi:hypothetical protein
MPAPHPLTSINDPPSVAGGESRRKDLVLGTVENYDFYEFDRFLLTLRQTNFAGHVCLFVGPGINSRTVRKIKRHGVEVIRYGRRFPFIADPHPDAPKSMPDPIHLFNYRHFFYYDYLLRRGAGFRNVLITDVKDVVFQKDPFDFSIEDALHVAMENPEIPIGACSWNRGWILAGYGAETLERAKDKLISCAGTTIGPVKLVERYLKLMLGQIAEMKDAYECADQAAHNLLLHDGALEPVKRLRNFEGPILTVGTEPVYRLNREKALVNRDGSIIAVVHQYDRHEELVRIFDARARPSRWRRYVSKAAFRLRTRTRALLRRAHG